MLRTAVFGCRFLKLYTDNTHRSLEGLVSVNAWFSQDPDNFRKLSLHADVSFGEERLGGDPQSSITFKLSVKRCDIIFILPSAAPFRIDPASVRSPQPLNPKQVTMTDRKAVSAAARAKLSVASRGPSVSADVEVDAQSEKSSQSSSQQLKSMYHEVWKRVRGNHAWTVDGRELEQQRLAGPVFNAKKEPRLSVIDQRSEDTHRLDAKNNIEPVSTIRVSCLREDIDIYDIAYKDPKDQVFFERKKHKDLQLFTARQIIENALLSEGLVAGDLTSDPFAEMTICDVAISIIDEGA